MWNTLKILVGVKLLKLIVHITSNFNAASDVDGPLACQHLGLGTYMGPWH